MAKSKFRFYQEIIHALKHAEGALSLKKLLAAILPKEEQKSAHLQRVVERELRQLVKLREVEKVSGSLYRLRPPKQKGQEESNRSDGGRRRDPRDRDNRPERRSSKAQGYIGKVSKNNRGFAFVALENPPPLVQEDIFLNPEEAEDLLTGDRVEISIDPRRSERGFSGRLLKVVERGLQKVVAKYNSGANYLAPFAEVDTKDMQIQIFLEKNPLYKDLADGAAILVEVTQGPQGRIAAKGKILSVLADSLNSTTDDPYIITKHKLRENFPDEVLHEAEAIPLQIQKDDFKGRTDLRELPFVTIDGADARDFDDAICSQKIGGGKVRLWVAIADVAHYVRFGTALDKEAYERGTSIYFPHRVLPMLPERLSNGICSLNPNEDRLAMVCEMEFDAQGRKLKHDVYEAVFRSQHRCVYEELQKYYDEPSVNTATYNRAVLQNLQTLFPLYKALHKVRIARGAIDLNLPEAKVKVNKRTGEVDTIVRTERTDTHRLIEEFMIAANEAVSEFMEDAKQAFLFRVHETPDEEATKRFMDVAKSMAVKVNDSWLEDLSPHTYQKMVNVVETSPAAKVLNFLLLRSMKQAYYSSENLRHFGLASQAYTHFTSPIRRYPDLIVHRLLKAFIHKNKKEAKEAPGTLAEDLAAAALHCSQRERIAVDAERELIRMKQVRFAERHLGEEHEGIVNGITAKGAFVELKDVFIEGFVPLDRLGPDFIYNEKLMILKGKRTGRTIRIGDSIYVQIAKTNPHLLQIELEPVTNKLKKPKIAGIPAPAGAPAKAARFQRQEPLLQHSEIEEVEEEIEEEVEEIDAREMWKPEDFE